MMLLKKTRNYILKIDSFSTVKMNIQKLTLWVTKGNFYLIHAYFFSKQIITHFGK